jgi:hypothetical protein
VTYNEIIEGLKQGEWKFKVKRKLTAGERRAVDEGLVIMRAEREYPKDVLYIFRYIDYYLIKADDCLY